MYSARFSKSFFAVALIGSLAGCSSSSSGPAAPVIDSFSVSPTATVGPIPNSTSQGYVIGGKISFHDDSENVTQYSVHVDLTGAIVPDSAPQGVPATKSATDLPFELYLDSSAPKGDAKITVTLYGASGAKTASSPQTVTLQ